MKKVWIFASGGGSNAEKLFAHFKNHTSINITGLLCNNSDAGVISKAQKEAIPVFQLSNAALNEHGKLLALLHENDVDYIILAGFLRKIPDEVVKAFPNRIINIHPALLPKYGGKGMYGMHVHKAVKAAGEKISGITIHLVNEHYDEGRVLFQESVSLSESDSAEDIARKVLALEHAHFPSVCEKFILE
ncbi:MAG: phosphoribosylglycinamide formyltransferase [Flavobacteriales bacterium]|nr:phosphoribosylglycinamide formyltransferase [Flavobacteriales bacterium]